uniref:tyrosine-protein kinase family protein n=1 Tax=Aquiflexum sp. TaxID=1872584 RepID=UPI0035942357
GPTPPNPGEMILSPRLHELIKDLKSNYDFILLDAPPIGPVADAFEINKLADATLFVVRVGTTRRHQLHYLNDLIKDQKLTNLCIVLNGVGVGGLLSYGTRFEYMKYHEAH